MSRFMNLLWFAWLLCLTGNVGCALLDTPAVLSALDLVAEEVLKRTGQEMDAHPTHCEYENDPDSGKLLILCTVCYDLPDGERCQ